MTQKSRSHSDVSNTWLFSRSSRCCFSCSNLSLSLRCWSRLPRTDSKSWHHSTHAENVLGRQQNAVSCLFQSHYNKICRKELLTDGKQCNKRCTLGALKDESIMCVVFCFQHNNNIIIHKMLNLSHRWQ